MESRKSIKNLAGSIRSLLGLKTHLTSTWADSVCNIIKDLPCEKPFNSSQAQTLKIKAGSHGNKDTDDVGTDVLKIQDDLADLNADLNKLNLLRRQALNDFLDLKGNIRVFCRIRPTIEGETFGTLGPVVAADSSNVVLRFSENKVKRYSFNKVFHPGSTQDEVFAEVEPVIKSALDGYNACIFAYGQTGTGKTFTMEGQPDSPGVVPLAIEALFNQAQDSSHSFVFTFSMLEIYMGNLRDLLLPQTAKSTDTVTQSLSIQKDPKGGVEIDNLVAIRVSDFNQAKRLYGIGSRFRSTASTNANVTSSRSHCLTRISMTCFDAPERRRETNKLWMVDLGGSERVLKTKAWGRRLDEGKAINLSLSALGDVISALQRRKSHVPYRNSKLTQVLTDSLGEDSKTLMIVHVSPKEEDLCETVCSLGFATRVRSIHLGHDESSDVKAKKEVAMAQLQQKVKQLEYESQHIKKDIKKLKERLIQFTGAGPSPGEHIEFEHIYDQLPRSKDRDKCTMLDRTVSVPAQLPRFMRPTVCSKRKSGKDQTATLQAKKKDSLGVRRKKPSSLRAESVTFPLKANSEYGSECSVSRTSCLTDYETEYSNNTSECDIKMVIFPEQKRPHKVLGPSNPLLSHKSPKESENSEADKIHNWLHLRNTEPTSAYIHGSKRMDAIPPLHKNNEFTGELKHNENQNEGFTLKEFNRDKLEKIAHKQLHGRSSSVKEVAIDETKYNLDNHMTWEHGTTLLPPSHQGKAYVETRSLLECFGIEDSECYSIDNLHSGLIQKKDYSSVEAEMIDQRASNDVTESMLGCSVIDENKNLQVGAENRSCSGVRNEVLTTDRSEVIDQGDVAQTPVLDENKMEEKEMTELCVSQDVEVLARSCLLKFKSRRALFSHAQNSDGKNYKMPLAKSEERKCRHTNTGGILDVIGQKVQVICASTLLGLGLQNVGLGHDFFNALII